MTPKAMAHRAAQRARVLEDFEELLVCQRARVQECLRQSLARVKLARVASAENADGPIQVILRGVTTGVGAPVQARYQAQAGTPVVRLS